MKKNHHETGITKKLSIKNILQEYYELLIVFNFIILSKKWFFVIKNKIFYAKYDFL